MQLFPGLLLIPIFFRLDPVSAAPTATQLQPRSFKVERHRVWKRHVNPQNALAKVYAKYNVAFPGAASTDDLAERSSEKATGKVTNYPTENDVEFLSPVRIGGQKLMMNLDSGSSDIWAFNTNMPPSQQKHHARYDPWTSRTWSTLDGYKFNISYGDGSRVSGFVGTDVVNIGGATVTSQAIGLPTYVSGRIRRDTDSDGIIGLSFSSMNTIHPKKQHTFFDNVSGSLAEPLLTANLKHNTTGFYEFGRIDPSIFKGELQWVPILNNGYWRILSMYFGVGSRPEDVWLNPNPNSMTAIADTGTSLMLVDPYVAHTYYKAVPNARRDPDLANSTVFPCDTKLPDFRVALGLTYVATIPGYLMNFADLGNNTCYGSIQSNLGLPYQIYGDPLFKSQVAVFNVGNQSMGFAPHVGVPGAEGRTVF